MRGTPLASFALLCWHQTPHSPSPNPQRGSCQPWRCTPGLLIPGSGGATLRRTEKYSEPPDMFQRQLLGHSGNHTVDSGPQLFTPRTPKAGPEPTRFTPLNPALQLHATLQI